MNKDKKHDLTLFYFSITWLEKYIEQAHFFSDWEKRKQTDTSVILWVTSETPTDKILKNLGTCLHIGFAHNGKGKDDETPEFREAVKKEFYKWINAVKIDDSCPEELKKVLFVINRTIESKEGGHKLHKSVENTKRELDPDSPEYKEQLQKAFSLISEAHANGKAFEVIEKEFSGNAEVGKATFETLANSLSDLEKENFHFWPQMSEEERAEEERKNKERINRGDNHPLQAKRTHAVNEIMSQEPQLPNNYLKPENQNWRAEINSTEDIIEIQNIQNRVLADIKGKKQTFLHQEKDKKITKMFLISGIVLLAVLILIVALIFYYRKRNEKRK